MSELARYVGPDEAAGVVRSLGATLGTQEYAVVRNIDYVYAPHAIYPFSRRVSPPLPRIAAFAVDMDGTSTTTEPLALHALEYMVRRFTGLLDPGQWSGLDKHLDYPHVIGNSNFRHAEYLLNRYADRLNRHSLRDAFFQALCWTLASMSDPQRRRDVMRTATNCGLGGLLKDEAFQRLVSGGELEPEECLRRVTPFIERFGNAFRYQNAGALVPACLDIYYMRYHSIMRAIEQGRGEALSQELLGEPGRLLIEPMAAYDVFVPLVKGWLGPEAESLYEPLRAHLLSVRGYSAAQLDGFRGRMGRLGAYFHARPAKLALVTASIAYETHTTLREVFRVMAMHVRDWPVPMECRDRVIERVSDYRAAFDAVVNASDACEHRLKPHPDLYSLALAQMGMAKSDYAACVGLEDTEPGIISLRAAGIGCAIALPNHDTSRQNYQAATLTVQGGLPELILHRNLLLDEEATA